MRVFACARVGLKIVLYITELDSFRGADGVSGAASHPRALVVAASPPAHHKLSRLDDGDIRNQVDCDDAPLETCMQQRVRGEETRRNVSMRERHRADEALRLLGWKQKALRALAQCGSVARAVSARVRGRPGSGSSSSTWLSPGM